MNAPKNPPAFPMMHGMEFVSDRQDAPDYQVGTRMEYGMTLRDYFAAAALPSVLSHYLVANGNGCAADHALRNVPVLAYKYADAMLAERVKGGR